MIHLLPAALSTLMGPKKLLRHCIYSIAAGCPCAVASVALDHRLAHKLLTAGMGVARWTKALGDLQGLGCSLSRSNMEALFRSAVHAPVRIHVLCIGPAYF